MTDETAREIFEHLFSMLETMDTKSEAMLQLVRDKKLATEAELARYTDQAGNASSVRWLAARARIQHLLTPVKAVDAGTATKPADKETQERKEGRPAERKEGEPKREDQSSASGNSGERQPTREEEMAVYDPKAQNAKISEKPEAKGAGARPEQSPEQSGEESKRPVEKKKDGVGKTPGDAKVAAANDKEKK